MNKNIEDNRKFEHYFESFSFQEKYSLVGYCAEQVKLLLFIECNEEADKYFQ